mmetsp:Transcript_11375/g.22530  ORF Transcript_11375/g.22530 Transcript_11375/m.22530 type:complete len:399 (+) Transcript_11375:76-1272(+)
MAAVRRKKERLVRSTDDSSGAKPTAPSVDVKKKLASAENDLRKAKKLHLIPWPVVAAVTFCSGFMWVFAMRDVFSTGKHINALDMPMQKFINSEVFYDDSKGWKSQKGGISIIQGYTTDANNMGGLLLRKVSGVAALAVHSHKLAPVLFQPDDLHWGYGHFDGIYFASVISNLAIFVLYHNYYDDMKSADADGIANLVLILLLTEAMILFIALLSRKISNISNKVKMINTSGKPSNAIVARIVGRTVAIVSSAICLIAIRDLFFPGQVISRIPRDDVYLEWTGAFIHSPPIDSPEYEENYLEAPLFVGDKFVSQLCALHLILSCLMKFTTAFFIKVGKDGSGKKKCKYFWKIQAITGLLLLFIFRLFAGAATSASLDLRWHLMLIGYEAGMFCLYGFL